MRTVWGIGETVYDLVFKNNQPVSANAGGSVLNSMVSLARLGHKTQFISEIGNDKAGKNIIDFLNQNNIRTDFIQLYDEGKTAIALAFLNDKNDAEYDFYKIHPPKRELNVSPDFKENDIVLFASFYAIDPAIHSALNKIIIKARESGCIIIYDPNFRKKHGLADQYLPFIKENVSHASILKGSDEDFVHIFATHSAEETFNITSHWCSNLTYTKNSNGVDFVNKNLKEHYPVPAIKTISTIGAGDNFNSGIIHSLLEQNITVKDIPHLTEKEWHRIIQSGIDLSSRVCMSILNYID